MSGVVSVTKNKLLLILGSGFSKAVFSDMPTVMELARCLEEEDALRRAPYKQLLGDPELLLSYLSLDQPWKKSEEALNDAGLFIKVQRRLAGHIARCEDQVFKDSIPDWASHLVQFLHEARVPVITLNYDTVMERLVHLLKEAKSAGETWPREYDLYDLPLSPIQLRESGTLSGVETHTFQLIKLHGSINWFYSGVEGFPGEQVYYRPVNASSPLQDGRGRFPKSSQKITRLEKDKVPLIIPPVAEKSRFYGNRTIRTLWADARKALKEAEEILCVGYSLPVTDLTMKLFLQSVARPKRIAIVNKEDYTSKMGQELVERYRVAFPEAEVDGRSFSGSNSVERMVEHISSVSGVES